MEFMGNDGHAPSLPILCGFASVSHTVACARTNKSECLSKNEVFRQSVQAEHKMLSLLFMVSLDREIPLVCYTEERKRIGATIKSVELNTSREIKETA